MGLHYETSDWANAPCMQTSLNQLRDNLKPSGVKELVYGLFTRPHSYVQKDAIVISTLPNELMSLYNELGGVSNDPIAENLAVLSEPMFIDLKKMYHDKNSGKFYKWPYTKKMIDMGYTSLWTCPFSNQQAYGFGTMTFFQSSDQTAPKLIVDDLLVIGASYHLTMWESGKLADFLNLTPGEVTALTEMARGQNAIDIALLENVTTRTIENRLQRARKKLRSRTTPEAIYKAMAYGILTKNNFLK